MFNVILIKNKRQALPERHSYQLIKWQKEFKDLWDILMSFYNEPNDVTVVHDYRYGWALFTEGKDICQTEEEVAEDYLMSLGKSAVRDVNIRNHFC